MVAEAVRFELTEDFHPRQFSRLVHSTTLPRFLGSYHYKDLVTILIFLSELGKNGFLLMACFFKKSTG